MPARRDEAESDEATGFFQPILGDGRPLLLLTAGSLNFAGCFAILRAIAGKLLPHDIHYLGMDAADICRAIVRSCQTVDLMARDRAVLGGVLCGVGVLYLWLTVFPLGRGEQWAWWTLWISGATGVAGFLAYLGNGYYLATWQGAATLLLLPVFVTGMGRTRRVLAGPLDPRRILRRGPPFEASNRITWGRVLLLIGAGSTALAGLTIMWSAVTDPVRLDELPFYGLSRPALGYIAPRFAILLTHDRAGFGGGIFTMGLTIFLCLWCARPSRDLLQAVAGAGGVSLTTGLVAYGTVRYADIRDLTLTLCAALTLVVGLALAWPARTASELGRRRSHK